MSNPASLAMFPRNAISDRIVPLSRPSEPEIIIVDDDSEPSIAASSAASSSSSASSHASSASSLGPMLKSHLKLLDCGPRACQAQDETVTPLFTESVREFNDSKRKNSATKNGKPALFTQYGLLGGHSDRLAAMSPDDTSVETKHDPRIYYNVAAPSSVFICGSQGSGKSHTLSCLLENCMVRSSANTLPRPLSGIVFHYDTFISDTGGSPCEAAFLSSDPNLDVRVVCAPTNIAQIKRIYAPLKRVRVEEFRLSQADLNTGRMLDLMAASSIQGSMPLYMHIIVRILRDMRIKSQEKNTSFDYATFKREIEMAQLTKDQMAPLLQRLDTLESFMVHSQANAYTLKRPGGPQQGAQKKKKKGAQQGQQGQQQGTNGSSANQGNVNQQVQQPTATLAQRFQKPTIWETKAGQLTIVDLSCPCVTAEMACLLFNTSLSLFLEQPSTIGRVIALDEAHKYMKDTSEASTLTESLLSTIRLQRHLGARVIISTQEPTISPRLLDLCTITIVHRFTSPDWLQILKRHLAGASDFRSKSDASDDSGQLTINMEQSGVLMKLFSEIITLRTGEALVFSPTALLGVDTDTDPLNTKLHSLGNEVMKVRIRKRVTRDGGRSIMAA
ncbi:hypothetical protein B0I35DRAFT_476155 [Stachybotrys elegans]|uniref:AAA+ ATPase domain-containing protein n=1 Tax=Stachybotrys elegans TaxID=80388 RepID=A0A8K0SXX0_9HYPO|nr:hypothetical protein B0I35DRAFT_476155 [Stachybotrys elegans]